MMRIRITQQQPEGAELNGRPWPGAGEEIDVPTAQGAHLVAAGVAEEAADAEDAGPRAGRRKARPPKESADG